MRRSLIRTFGFIDDSLTRMHFFLVLVALVATWQTLGPVEAGSLQTIAPCKDLSPHCPALCASCEAAGQWSDGDHGSFEFFAPDEPTGRPQRPSNHSGKEKPVGLAREKRLANGGKEGRGWFQIPQGERPGWLPSWIPWVYKPRPGTHGRPGGGPSGPSGSHGGHGGQSSGDHSGGQSGGHSGGDGGPSHGRPPHGGPGGPELPSKECVDLVMGGRQLVEAFCPQSCGRCGRSSSPVAAAKVFISAQCSVAKEPAVGLALS